MTIQQIVTFVKSNQIIAGLLVSAVVITMPETLPGWRDAPQWFWGWFRDSSKTFFNMRHSGAPVTDAMHQQQQALTQQPKVVAIQQENKLVAAAVEQSVPLQVAEDHQPPNNAATEPQMPGLVIL
jgi:hypothetical protein